jgi:tRNA1(Val) A37 N6-methylase TrmN6
MEPKRLRMVQHTAAAQPSLILLEARRGGNPGLSMEPPLILRDDTGQETQEVREIYFRTQTIST